MLLLIIFLKLEIKAPFFENLLIINGGEERFCEISIYKKSHIVC